MNRHLTIAGIVFAGALAFAPSVSAARVIVRPSIGFGYRYGYSRPFYPGWYSPYWVGPTEVHVTGLMGEVKLDISRKSNADLVYVDNAYLGPAGKFKRFDLKPGNHEVELRTAQGNVLLKESVQVAVDRTTEIDARRIGG